MLHYIALFCFFWLWPRTVTEEDVTLVSVIVECFTSVGSLRVIYLLMMLNIMFAVISTIAWYRVPRTMETVLSRENGDMIALMLAFLVINVLCRV